MSKKSQMRWKDSDYERLKKDIKNFNAKIDYWAKKQPELKESLPQRKKMKDIKEKIYSRQDFNREVKSMERFKKANPKDIIIDKKSGLSLTKYEVREVQILTNAVNLKRKNEAKKLNVDVTLGNMGTIEQNNLKPKIFSTNKTRTDWEKFKISAEKELMGNYDTKKLAQYKENFLKSLKKNFENTHGFKSFYNKIKNMTPEELYNKTVDNPKTAIPEHYDENQESELLLSIIIDEINK